MTKAIQISKEMPSVNIQTILSIAGSDPSGGAGIQADLKTINALNIYGCAATTCITVQNTLEVKEILPLPAQIVYEQIHAVLEDLPVSHIKIGMVGSAEIANAIHAAIANFTGEIIYDPVLASSAGPALTQENDLPEIMSGLGSQVTVLTPNHRELQQLSGSPCQTTKKSLQTAWGLFKLFPALKALVIKGGHLDTNMPQINDYLLLASHRASQQVIKASHPRLESRNTHGTGCTFASAFAAFHQKTGCYQDSFRKSSDFVNRLLKLSSPYSIGGGTGGMQHHLMKE